MLKVVFMVVIGATSYFCGVYTAIEANHTHKMNALISLISVIKRFLA